MAPSDPSDPSSEMEAKTLLRVDKTAFNAGVPAPPRWVEDSIHPVDDAASFDEPQAGAFRYEVKALLGEGGMGQVHLCRDALIGREVALKMMLPELEGQPHVRARFLREARVQGQLEHPGIVPVHEIGISPDGATYFTMKRVRGRTLASVIEDLAAGVPDAEARFSQRRLLAAFVSVCLAVDFAHGRGVLHRDLKPGNIMLGAYGEVSVLDWGLAKPEGDAPSVAPGSLARVSDESIGALPPEAHTALGALLGTPGYMAPEYVLEGLATAQGDVFALGAILFEILALEPLYPRLGMRNLVSAMVQGADPRLSARCPNRPVAPELESICVKATARFRVDRYKTARELSEAVERFLEGDRDLVRRREQAQAHADAAAAEVAGPRGATEAARTRAMRDLGHALALDPDNTAARATLIRVLTEPPDAVPAEVTAAMEASAQTQLRMGASLGGRVMLVWFLFLPLFWWMGMRDLTVIVSVLGPIGLAATLSLLESRRPVVRPWVQYLNIVSTCFAIAATSRIFGPFMLMPTMAATYALSMQVHPHATPRKVTVALACLAMVVPILLEAAGVLPRTITVHEGSIVIRTLGVHPEGPVIAFLAIAGVAGTLAAAFFIAQLRDALSRTERRVHLHAWHVQRMVPEGLPIRAQMMKSIPRMPKIQRS